jgi:hypothetical protein
MSKARDLANAGTALTSVSSTELGYLDGVTSAVQTQINAQIPKSTVTAKGDLIVATGSGTVVAQAVGTDGQFLQAASAQADGVQWATVSQYALPSQTGNSGKFLTTNGTAESWGTVAQPLTWTSRLASTGNAFTAVASNGSNIHVAVGEAGQLYSSSDGVTWTSRTSQFGTTNIRDVHFGNGLFVAVGELGKISTSTDGTTWTARTSNMGTNLIINVIYANSLWVAVGSGGGTTNTGGIIYSTDGLTWTRKSQSITVGTDYRCVIWNGTNWVVGASISTNNTLYAATPGGTWTALIYAGGNTMDGLWQNGSTTIVNNANAWYFTTSATMGSISGYSDVTSGAFYPQTAKLYNGSIYAANAYLQNWVAGTNSYPEISTLTFAPTTNFTGTTLSNRAGGYFVGAIGRIFADSRGRIYTSF